MTNFTPTPEQLAALDVFITGEPLVLEAGAGTGKTSTLRLLGEATTSKGMYVAYNKAIATEAAESFPHNVTCRTAHSLAFAAVGRKFSARLSEQERQPWTTTARRLGVHGNVVIRDHTFSEPTQARLALEMVGNFCNSADREITAAHVPFVEGLRGRILGQWYDYHPVLARQLLPVAQHAWRDLQAPHGVAPFTHDHYLKMWQLGNPRIKADFILFDEAQDANPAMADIVGRQQSQQIYVGDRAQAIYGWRGAVDAMDQIEGAQRRLLSQSFRFGQTIADEANYWLSLLDTPLRLTGNPAVSSTIEPVPYPDVILCRTNAGQLEVLMSCLDLGMKAHLVGGVGEQVRFAKAVQDLQAGRSTSHRDLIAFANWDEVRVHANEEGGSFAVWVKLIDKHGTATVLQALEAVTPGEADADVTISTAHKAKGREWSSVRIHADFLVATDDDGVERELEAPEVMLRYVAVTRAKRRLDITALLAEGVA